MILLSLTSECIFNPLPFVSGRMEDVNFCGTLIVPRGPFVERPGNFSPSGPKVRFKITENLLSSRTVPHLTNQSICFFFLIVSLYNFQNY